ncbi:MAG TPA: hypothetical protein VHH73_03290 [Verrucomicrobiae bacterium]|nr:hypothetical protein [Verrucomicrobiae bacterium]
MITAGITPLTYPARPVNGGAWEHAMPKIGEWLYEPKFNGWRALVHIPSGAMFNRHGQQLSIAAEFQPALRDLSVAHYRLGCDWLDVECLERRHNIGRGSLIVLDLPDHATLPYAERQRMVAERFVELPDPRFIAENLIYRPSVHEAWEVNARWRELQAANVALGCDFYEGLVAKRADSPYPVQLHSPEFEFPFWMKHRWRF